MEVVIGRIGRPHGIRGEVTVESRTDDPDRRFAPGTSMVDDGGRTLIVEGLGAHGGRLRVKFAGVDDRTAAESLRGQLLRIERGPDDQPEDPDEFYDTDLIGMCALYVDGSELGVVRDVLHLPGQDLLAIDHAGREVLVPFVATFVPEVDVARRVVVVDPPPGLLEA